MQTASACLLMEQFLAGPALRYLHTRFIAPLVDLLPPPRSAPVTMRWPSGLNPTADLSFFESFAADEKDRVRDETLRQPR